MDKLRATDHHYIRCLKPNQTLQAGDWDNEFMFKQLAYSGTLEVTEIRKAGLNVRRPLEQSPHIYPGYISPMRYRPYGRCAGRSSSSSSTTRYAPTTRACSSREPSPSGAALSYDGHMMM